MAVFREAQYTMYSGIFIGGLVADVRVLPDAEHKISTRVVQTIGTDTVTL